MRFIHKTNGKRAVCWMIFKTKFIQVYHVLYIPVWRPGPGDVGIDSSLAMKTTCKNKPNLYVASG